MNYDKRLLKYVEQFKQKLMSSEGTEIDTQDDSESEE